MMAVIDLWYLKRRGPDKKKLPSKRHGRGKRWRVDWIDPATKKPCSQSFEKKEGPGGADEWDKQVHADISRGKYVDPKAGEITVAEYARQWRESQIHGDSTAAGVESFFRLHLEPAIGQRSMATIRRADMQAWVKDRLGALKPSSFRTGWRYAKRMFEAAVIDDVISKNPCVGVTLPPDDDEDRYIPTPKEVHALAEKMKAIHPGWAPVVYIAAGLGLRLSEIFGLELGNVDFQAMEVSIVQQLKWTKVNGVHIGKVKTATSKRTLDLPRGVADGLREHLAIHPARSVKLWDRRDIRKPVEREAQLVFTTPAGVIAREFTDPFPYGGGPVYGGRWSTAWPDVVAAAGLPAGFGIHGLRHYFATLLIHKGKSVATVQLALGHAKPSITLDTYTHEWPDAKDRTRDIVDEVLFNSVEGIDTDVEGA